MKEIEYKFLLDDKQRKSLVKFLEKNNAEKVKEEEQDNFYYVARGNLDLRIRRTEDKSLLILKKGWMHDEDREELEVECDRDDFDKLDEILTSLGYEYDTKWYRKRVEYKYKDFSITIDFNAGYGYVTEIELVVDEGKEKESLEKILKFAKELGIEPTPKETFDKMYEYYKKQWQKYYDTKEVFDLERALG